MAYKPRKMPEDVNVTSIHPLVNFANLIGTVILFSALAYFGLGLIANRLATHISPATEVKIGQHLIASYKTPKSDLEKSHLQQQQYLEKLLASLKTSNPRFAIPLSITLIDNEIANAAILPGGNILVTTALLEEAESENEIAFVLAHELGHHLNRDPLKALGRSLVFLTVSSVLGIGGGNTDAIAFTGLLTNLHYSRQQESAADVYALQVIIDKYGHGGSSLSFFERVKTKDKRGKLASYVSTHPLTQERINYLQQLARENGWQMTGKITELPAN